MVKDLRRTLTFSCEDSNLIGTLDDGTATAGLLIVSGGNEVRSGAHRGMAELAAVISAAGWPVFRFDRRGVGDSEGTNGSFTSSAPDLATALAAFRAACPHLHRIIGFGNCDAASALVLHDVAVDTRVLANPWIIEPTDDLPPPAAIRDRYAKRLRDPKAWIALVSGKLDLRALLRGLSKLAARAPAVPDSLAEGVRAKLSASRVPTMILLASGDATALAFDAEWRKAPIAGIAIERIDSASHSFASDADFAALVATLTSSLRG